MIRQLRGRSTAELRERVAQKLAAMAERGGLLPTGEPGVAELSRALRPECRARYAKVEAWGEDLLPGRFFPGVDDLAATREAVMACDPGFRAWCLDRAERALQGRIDVLGHCDVSWGVPINWHRDPLAGIQAPAGHWSTIRYLDTAVVGDHKVLWEVNRHQWLVTLAQAAALTGDPRWTGAVERLLVEWMDANPPGRGVNWASSLEVAFRAIAWIWVLRLLPSRLSPSTCARVAGVLLRSARHLERYLSTYFSPNTHLTGEALGLLYLGTQLRQFAASDRWVERGWRILNEQLPRHLREDGVYFEQASWYQRYTVDFYLHAWLLAERNGLDPAPEFRSRLEAGLEHLMAIMRPDGTMPLIGDDDGGKLVVLDPRASNDVRAPLAQGAICFGRSDFAWAARGCGAETIWLLGPRASSSIARLEGGPPLWASRAFRTGGYFVMRDGWGPAASVMVLDCGPHGVMNGGHAHADALALDLTVQGVPVLVDPGTGSYSDPAIRNHFRSTSAHNAVTVGGRSSSLEAGPFQWSEVAVASPEVWVASRGADFFRGRHDGYRGLPAPVTVRRAVLHVHNEYWVVRDEICGSESKEHDVLVTFQSAEGLQMDLRGQERVVCWRGEGAVLSILTAGLGAGSRVTVDASRVAPCYGRLVEAPAMHVRISGAGQTSCWTLLVPGEAEAVSCVSAQPDMLEVTGPWGTDLVRIGTAGPWRARSIRGDVGCAWIRRSVSGGTLRTFACDGTTLLVDDVAHPVEPGGEVAALAEGPA